MAIAHPSIRAQTKCLCGCGKPPTGRSRYHAGHYSVLKRCRARFRKLKNYAHWKRIQFDLTLDDVRALIGRLPDVGDGVAIERKDLTLGFAMDNVLLRARNGTRRAQNIFPDKVPTNSEIGAMVAKIIERQLSLNFSGTPELTLGEVLQVYGDQKGCCALSGEPLLIDRRLHPESLALTRRDPQGPWTRKNTVLVGLALKPFIDKWGARYLVKVARRIMKTKEKEQSK